ncbi:MAG: family 16 glycosylhydrolase [Bacteroidia bacterium]
MMKQEKEKPMLRFTAELIILNCNQHTAQLPLENMVDEFHTYGVIGHPKKSLLYVDDNPYLEYGDTKDSLTWPFDIPQNIILNSPWVVAGEALREMDENMTLPKIGY